MKRTKIMIICSDYDKTRDEYIEWCAVLEEHLGKKAKCKNADRRIETPHAIIDFTINKLDPAKGYTVILNANEDNEKVLRLAIGEELLTNDESDEEGRKVRFHDKTMNEWENIVEEWHNGKGEGQSLQEYMGLSDADYLRYVHGITEPDLTDEEVMEEAGKRGREARVGLTLMEMFDAKN